VIFAVWLLFYPLDVVTPIYDAIFQVMFSPLYGVTFFTAFLGDILTSTVKPIIDLSSAVCFYSTGEWRRYFYDNPIKDIEQTDLFCANGNFFGRYLKPLIISLPLFFRFMQSIRRYYDTSK